ncbi:MAG: ROK family protein [Actinomycetota bacterium]|nr:ROK family protein [Actinomycetota bacterium]
MNKAIAVDIGGTKISWALITDDYAILTRRQVMTPATTSDIFTALEVIITEALASYDDILGAGIGVAGMVDNAAGKIVAAPNLALAGEPLKQHLESKFKLAFNVDNDANCAVLGELLSGAGRGYRNFIGLTVGTGLGGGIVIDGRLYRGAKGAAAEFGHMVIDPNGPVCGCGHRGCLETKASGTAIERLAKETVVAKTKSALSRSVGGDPEIITGPMVAKAARAGDTEAVTIMTEVGRWLGLGIGNFINILDPEVVVVGGGVASSLDLVMDPIIESARRIVIDPRSRDIPIVISQLENSAGLLGAAGLIFGLEPS